MKHKYYENCGKHDCGGTCHYCTLSICKICGLFEGSLTTDCPGEKVSMDIADKIYDEKLDYRVNEGGWVNKFNPCNQSRVQSFIFDVFYGRNKESEASFRLKRGITKEEYSEIKSECIKYLMERKS